MQAEDRWDHTPYFYSDEPLDLPPKACQYFRILEQLLKDESKPITSNVVPAGMLGAFKRMSKSEKKRYITQNLKYLSSILNQRKNNCYLAENPYRLITRPSKIQVDCEKRGILCYYKPFMKLKLDTGSRTVLLNEDDNIKMVDLQNYLVYQDKNLTRNIVVLEPIVRNTVSWEDIKRYELIVPSKQFTEVYDQLFNCVMDIRNEELISLISNKNELRSEVFKTSSDNMPKKFINKKKYKEFEKFRKRILDDEGVGYANFNARIYEEQNEHSYFAIHQNSGNPRLFKMQISSYLDCYDLKENYLSILSQNKNTLLIESQQVEQYTPSCVALFQKYYLSETPQSVLYMRQIMSVTDLLMSNSIRSIISIQEKKRHDDFMFLKSIDSPIVSSFFNYICGFVNSSPSDKKYRSSLIIIGEFNIGESFTVPMVKEYFAEFDYILFGIAPKSQMSEQVLKRKESFKTTNQVIHKKHVEAIDMGEDELKSPRVIGHEKQVMVEFSEAEDGHVIRNQFIEYETKGKARPLPLFYKHKFNLKPIQGYDVEKNTVAESFMKGEWTRGQDGGLICTNQKLLSQHKKIFKYVLSSIGTNILKGGNILNVSLPVTIFKKQGHLQMIADSFSLAPKLFENVRDPLERMKKAIIVGVSVGTLGISVEKPFFPTLGETLQVWIGGCPMYMQQITRYPPTGAYLFYGRGYKIYGQVQPKISFGINGGKGYSERPSFIEFDDGQKIQLSYGKMVISGIFVGDRQFNFYDKNFAYDKQNNLFAELIYGARDTHVFKKNKQTKDFFYGKIYKLTPDFAQKFQKQGPPKPFPTKKYIAEVVSQFEGVWNGVIKFDDKQYIDFQTDLPSKVEVQQFALPSDTRFRGDLVNLIQGNVDQAQKQKTLLEETQRRDRKLRQQKGKSKK